MAPGVATEPLLSMSGKIKSLTPVAALNAVVTLGVLLLFSQFGLLAAAWSRLGASIFMAVTAIWLQTRHAQAPWAATLKKAAPVYTALIAMFASIYGARIFLSGHELSVIVQLGVEVFIGAVSYFVMIMIIRPSYLRTVFWL